MSYRYQNSCLIYRDIHIGFGKGSGIGNSSSSKYSLNFNFWNTPTGISQLTGSLRQYLSSYVFKSV